MNSDSDEDGSDDGSDEELFKQGETSGSKFMDRLRLQAKAKAAEAAAAGSSQNSAASLGLSASGYSSGSLGSAVSSGSLGSLASSTTSLSGSFSVSNSNSGLLSSFGGNSVMGGGLGSTGSNPMLGGSSSSLGGGLGGPSAMGGGLGSTGSNPLGYSSSNSVIESSNDTRSAGTLVSSSAPSLSTVGPGIASPPGSPAPSTPSYRTGKNLVAAGEPLPIDGEIHYSETIMLSIKRISLENYNPRALKPIVLNEQDTLELEKKLGKGL